MQSAPFLAFSSLAVAATMGLAAPAAAADVPIQVVIQNNMPVPVYTSTQAGGSACLRGIPGTTVPANGTIYVTLWITCTPMRGDQVFIPAIAGPEVRTSSVFGLTDDQRFYTPNDIVRSPAITVSLWKVSGEAGRPFYWPINPNAKGEITKLSFQWTLDCPVACAKP